MKSKTQFSTLPVFLFFFLFNACTIEGEQICGVWNAQGDYGQMKLEITPWEGKFHAYLLEYISEEETTKGAKEEKFIFLTDLDFQKDSYQNGKIYLDRTSNTPCDISLKLLNENQVQASYNCEGESFKEIWTREGIISSNSPPISTKTISGNAAEGTENTSPSNPTESAEKLTANNPSKRASQTPTKETKPAKSPPPTTPKQATKSQPTFHVIGVHQTVAYNDMQAVTKAVENLWNKTYANDFSGKLSNITDAESMYLVYSAYDQPQGKMAITIGYKVKNLANIPTRLKGVSVPSNEYYVYPLSGEASDYEGEGWKQLEEMMAYRKADSVDFEVYEFDSSYEVTKAEMWISAK